SFLGRYAFPILFVYLIGSQVAFARPCVVHGGRYSLNADTVDWSMKIASGSSCVRGVKLNTVTVADVTLVSPPKSGQVELQGLGFKYTANADFSGQDSFSLAVSGVNNEISGRSTINVSVSVVQTK